MAARYNANERPGCIQASAAAAAAAAGATIAGCRRGSKTITTTSTTDCRLPYSTSTEYKSSVIKWGRRREKYYAVYWRRAAAAVRLPPRGGGSANAKSAVTATTATGTTITRQDSKHNRAPISWSGRRKIEESKDAIEGILEKTGKEEKRRDSCRRKWPLKYIKYELLVKMKR